MLLLFGDTTEISVTHTSITICSAIDGFGMRLDVRQHGPSLKPKVLLFHPFGDMLNCEIYRLYFRLNWSILIRNLLVKVSKK
jgi:hypothetical protein